MEIIICPKCQKKGGYLVFRQAGNSKGKYPYVGHYDSSKVSRTRWCYLTENLLSKIDLNSTNRKVIEDYQNNKTSTQKFVDALNEQIKFLKKKQPKIIELGSILRKCDPAKYKEFLDVILLYNSRLREIVDELDKDPRAALHLLMKVSIALLTYLSSTYWLYKKLPKGPLSPKQIKKIMRLRVREIHPLYDPKNKSEALQCKFIGIQCKNCGSWRIDEVHVSIKFKSFHCYACGKNSNVPLKPHQIVSNA